MAKILVNYIYDKRNDKYEILDNKYVFADLKIAVMDTELNIETPLVVPIQGASVIVDRKAYEKVNKLYYLKAKKDGKLCEDGSGFPIWLPKETDISKLRLQNGQVVMVEDEEDGNKK